MEKLSPNSLSVFRAKYLRKNEKGEVSETPEDCFKRVAHFIASVEETPKLRKAWEEKFYQILANLEFLPGGRTLANAGTNYPQLANCFVLPLEDNIEEIFEVVKDSSILKKFGGGVGFSFSKIRPKNDKISGTSGAACGPVALMKIINSASEIFLQQGTRRSGNMVVLNVSHPDVLEFITVKKKQNVLLQINYSLGISDAFMKAVEKDKPWNLVNPRTGRVSSTVKARSIFEVAAATAWEGGDPGLIFLDRINRDNPTPQLGPIEAVNLCGEQPLLSYEACNLGSINLTKFLVKKENSPRPSLTKRGSLSAKPSPFRRGQGEVISINWPHLAEVVEIAVRFLDNVISAGRYPLSKVDRVVKGNRKIGLGAMGWADLLIKMGIKYDSQDALKLAERVMKFINDVSHETSQKLGREKGNFPNFSGSRFQKKVKFMRNATCTTIAPTGSISMVADVSSGIEPLFALSYYKKVFGGVRMPEVNADLLIKLDELGQSDKKDQILKTGSIARLKEIPENIRRVFVTSHEIPYEWHLKMQAAFQKYTDNAVSKTINLPNKTTIEDVGKAFTLAWKLGCKGITVYRDQSRSEQVLNVGVHVIPAKAEIQVQRRHAEFISASISNKKRILNQVQNDNKNLCPTCGKKLVREEGCMSCPNCGFSACEI